MNNLRPIAIVASLAAHAGFAYALIAPLANSEPMRAFDKGSGNDQFVVEQGVGLSGFVNLGEATETIRAAEIEPVEAAPPAPQEVKPVDELQDTIVSKSVAAADEHIVKLDEPPPELKPEEQKPVEIKPAEQVPVAVAVAQDASSGEEKKGGDTRARAEYYSKLVKLISECKFAPKRRVRGEAEIRMKFDERGNLVSREVVKSSGDDSVDRAALANVDGLKDCKEEGLPPAPEGLTVSDRTMVQKWTFR